MIGGNNCSAGFCVCFFSLLIFQLPMRLWLPESFPVTWSRSSITPNKHLTYLAQSHFTLWCVVLHCWVEFRFSSTLTALLELQLKRMAPYSTERIKVVPSAILVTGISNYWEGDKSSDLWIIRYFAPQNSLSCEKEVMWTQEQNWLKRESKGKGEETRIMHFPHWQELADWRKDTLALEKNMIFRKRRSYIFKKVLGCVGFQSAYREVGLASILL